MEEEEDKYKFNYNQLQPDSKIQKQSSIRVRGHCMVPWKGSYYKGQIIKIYNCGSRVQVKILDNQIENLDEWPIIEFTIQQTYPVLYKKCENLEDIISHLKNTNELQSSSIEQAFRQIDRKYFCMQNPYFDTAIDIGQNIQISAPHIHVQSLELLKNLFITAQNILDVGTGTGYMAAILGYLCPQAKITAIEYFQELTINAYQNSRKYIENSIVQRLNFVTGNGESGYLKNSPYDIIYVGFMCHNIPQCLVEQLKPGGRMIIPVGQGVSSYDSKLMHGQLLTVDKTKEGKIMQKELFSCSFEPSQAK